MDKMNSPLKGLGSGGNQTNENDNTTANTSNNDGLRKLPSGFNNGRLERTLDRRIEGRTLDRRQSDRRLDDVYGDEREDFDNKVDEDLSIPKKTDRKVDQDSALDKLKIFVPPVIRDYNTLNRFMHNHVVELRFTRRTNSKYNGQQAGQSRKMLCTTNWKFLSSMFTRRMFNWNTPKTRRGVSWYKQRNLIIVWDLMVDNFRIIPVGDIRFVSAYKCSSLIEKGRFLLFYRNNIRKLTSTDEAKYFNS